MSPTLRPPRHAPQRQRGVVLIFALITLVILLIGAAAMMHSMNASLFNAGNYGFKRDLANQGERALNDVIAMMNNGALGTEAARQTDNSALNYSASILPTNAQGLPLALLMDTAGFQAAGFARPDQTVAGMGVTIRYVVDRLCTPGPVTEETCTIGSTLNTNSGALQGSEGGGTVGGVLAAAVLVPMPVYRISIRVTGPRNTQSFFQATVTI